MCIALENLDHISQSLKILQRWLEYPRSDKTRLRTMMKSRRILKEIELSQKRVLGMRKIAFKLSSRSYESRICAKINVTSFYDSEKNASENTCDVLGLCNGTMDLFCLSAFIGSRWHGSLQERPSVQKTVDNFILQLNPVSRL